MSVSSAQIIVILVGLAWIIILSILWSHIKIQESCVEGWDVWVCSVGNLSGLGSSFIWSINMLPQIWKNHKRKSVDGLSFRWACANVIASLLNLNFVLRISVPLYIKISAIYMPILEILIIGQFASLSPLYMVRVLARIVLVILAVLVVALLLNWHRMGKYKDAMEWCAVVLWSIETFPQIWLNARRGSTKGQAPHTVLMTFGGKTTDYISMVCLDLPFQFQVMTFFSTSAAYVNIAQYFYYRHFKVYAVAILVMIVSFSCVMLGKIGWRDTFICVGAFVVVLFGGHYGEMYLFPSSKEEEQRWLDGGDGDGDGEVDDNCSAESSLLKSSF
jgi:hypothetical protein